MSCFQGRLNQTQRPHHGLCLAQTSRWFYWRQLHLSRFDNLGTVDGRNPANQLRLVVYPIIYRVLYIPGGAGFLPSTVSRFRVLQDLNSTNNVFHFQRCLTFHNKVFTLKQVKWGLWYCMLQGCMVHVDFMWHILEDVWSRYVRSRSCAYDLSHVLSSNVDNVSVKCTVAFWTWWICMLKNIRQRRCSGRRGVSTPCLGALFYRTGDPVGAQGTSLESLTDSGSLRTLAYSQILTFTFDFKRSR